MPKGICSVEGCEKQATARGWCPMHYMRWRKYGDVTVNLRQRQGPCSVNGCERKAVSLGLCKAHHQRKLRGKPLDKPLRPTPGSQTGCSVPGCDRPHKAHGFCKKHYTNSWWARRGNGDAYTARRVHHLATKYGLTDAQYMAMVAEQDGKCALCGEEPTGKTRSDRWLHVDHNHTTGEVRSLLCFPCNSLVGRIERLGLERFADYLRA